MICLSRNSFSVYCAQTLDVESYTLQYLTRAVNIFMNISYTGLISICCNVRFDEALRDATAVDELISKTVNEEDGAIERYSYNTQDTFKTSLV